MILCDTHQILLPNTNLLVSANRYHLNHNRDQSDNIPGRFTLVFAHCSSGHKEQWVTTITALLERYSTPGTPALVREAWALDAPNHGESAMLNQPALSEREPLSIAEYGAMLRYFATSKYVQGHNVVAIGHSAATSAWTLACAEDSETFTPLPTLAAVILIEPVMVTPPIKENDQRIKRGDTNTAGILARKQSWDSYSALSVWMKKRYPWKLWDPRVFDLYLQYGFVEVATDHSAGEQKQVVPKSLNAHEVGFYVPDDHVRAGSVTAKMCGQYSVHAIFGERPEMVSLDSRQSICDVSAGRTMATIVVVPKCGHLAVQENPDGVAQAIYDVLLLCARDTRNKLVSRM